MKKITKLFSMILVFVMLLVSATTTNVFADGVKGTITINKAVVGETYSIYKILTLETYDENNHYIYRVTDTWKGFVTSTEGQQYLTVVTPPVENGKTGDAYVTWVKDADPAAFAQAALKYAEDHDIEPATGHSKVAESTTVTFTDLDLGYYLVDSSLGALCHLTTTNPNGKVNEKNTVEPTVEKEVLEDSTNSYGEKNDAQIKDVVTFKTTITTGAGFYGYVLHDKMSEGLTYNNIVSVTVTKPGKAAETITAGENTYTVTTGENNDTFTITFNDTYIKGLPNKTVIVVEYTATVNEKAVIYEDDGAGNTNKTYLDFKNETTEDRTKEDTTTTYVYSFELVKTDSSNELLEGAEFYLYKNDKTTQIPVVYIDTDAEGVKYYRVAFGKEEGTAIQAGKVVIRGLDNETYYLDEDKAPEGYNPLTEMVKVDVNGVVNTDTDTYTMTSVTVVNYTGAELPETGGIGTFLFVTIGSLMVLAFGVLLVTKLRMSKISA